MTVHCVVALGLLERLLNLQRLHQHTFGLISIPVMVTFRRFLRVERPIDQDLLLLYSMKDPNLASLGILEGLWFHCFLLRQQWSLEVRDTDEIWLPNCHRQSTIKPRTWKFKPLP